MDWIKRNLYFLIGSVVALALMGLAGLYLYSKWSLNNEVLEKLNAEYAELQRLSTENPHPGSGKVNNILTAKEQQKQLVDFLKKTRTQFQSIPAIPDAPKVTSEEFSASLRRTIDQLQRAATNASVGLPQGYSFSFEAQKPRMTFASGSLELLAVQLGEVKVICETLFAGKINSLDNLRRERVSSDDSTGPVTDYIQTKSVTNELAILTPYEITIRCFSGELASVLSGFGSSPFGIMVKSINVEVAPVSTEPEMTSPMVSYIPAPGVQPPPSRLPGGRTGMEAEFANRYGLGGRGGRGAGMGGVPLRTGPPAPVYAPPASVPAYGAGNLQGRGGLPTVLDEKQLKVTMSLEIVKLLPSKRGETPAP
jgi:hypothetical protein